jgi:tetratricopeptide (TPR) repeat protein
MNYNQKHVQALTRFRRGEPQEAARLFAEALAERETSECWNDWATAQLACQAMEDAEAGYLRALELDPENFEPLVNLGAVYINRGRVPEALPLLRRAVPHLVAEQQRAICALIRECEEQTRPEDDPSQMEAFLLRLPGSHPSAPGPGAPGTPLDPDAPQWETCAGRYLATLHILPTAQPGQRLLQLGAGFRLLSPALARIKGYEVVCAANHDQSVTLEHRVRDCDSAGEYVFPVHQFPLESEPWPFEEASFDVVVVAEVLERANCDPMLILQQINRVLKPGGLLLIATPNIASGRSVARLLRGDNPYVFGQYLHPAGSAKGHAREYTPAELERVVAAAGFASRQLRTRNHRHDESGVLRQLLGLGMPITRRGEEILLLAQKQSGVRERFPAELYAGGDDGFSEGGAEGSSLPQQAKTGLAGDPEDGALTPLPPVLVVHERLPEIDGSALDVWLLEMLGILRDVGYPITYVAHRSADPGRCQAVLHEMGIEVFAGDPACRQTSRQEPLQNASSGAEGFSQIQAAEWFPELLQTRRFTIALLLQDSGLGVSIPEHYLNDIRRRSPATKVAVLTDGRPSAAEFRLAAASGLITDEERARGLQQREHEAYGLADLVLAAGDAEGRALTQLDPKLKVEPLPRVARLGPPGPGWSERSGLLLLSRCQAPQDRDALQWFVGEIWPRLRRTIPGVKLHVAGDVAPVLHPSAPTPGAPGTPWGSAEDVAFIGCWPGLVPTLSRYRLLLSPLRLGSGIRAENLTALAHGLPLVTTTTGAEGLQLTDGIDAMVADSPMTFAAAVTRVYHDEALWTELATCGRSHIERNFSSARFRPRFEAVFAQLCVLPPALREKDHAWSVRKVEEFRPDVPSACGRDVSESAVFRMHAYADYAELLLDQGRPEEACEQLRHIFAFAPPSLPAEHFFANILILMERCYRALGDHARGARCGREALQFIPELRRQSAAAPAGRANRGPAAQRSTVPAPVLTQEP